MRTRLHTFELNSMFPILELFKTDLVLTSLHFFFWSIMSWSSLSYREKKEKYDKYD